MDCLLPAVFVSLRHSELWWPSHRPQQSKMYPHGMNSAPVNCDYPNELFVSEELLNRNEICCPRCKSSNVTVVGTMQNQHREDWSDGQRIHVETGKKGTFVIEGILCACGTTAHVMSNESTRLQLVNQALRQQLVALTGRDPLNPGQPN